MKRFIWLGLAAALAACGSAAAGGALPPSGVYACMADSGSQYGSLEINGGSYRGVDFTPAGPFHALQAGAGGALAFTGGLGDFSAAGVKIGEATFMGTQGSSNHQPWIRIKYTTPAGNDAELDCERQP